jgi:syntaxin-binding protein 1
MLDEPDLVLPDRLRLIALYILFKNGILDVDIQRLLLHAKLPTQDDIILKNLELLGARVTKPLKDVKPTIPLFPPKPVPQFQEELSISRYEPVLKRLLEEHVQNTLSPDIFPYVKPELAPSAEDMNASMTSASLRSVKSTWASRNKAGVSQPRQRIIVFMGGGATYSEARACYEVAEASNRDVYLVTSHMLTPGLFLQQLGDLSSDRRQLGIPADRPAKKAPAHLFEQEAPPRPVAHQGSGLSSTSSTGGPPTDRMGSMNLNGGGRPSGSASSGRPPGGGPIKLGGETDPGKLRKEKDKYDEKKKKHHFFSSSKK